MDIIKKQIAFNRTKRTEKPKYIVIHNTGNTSSTADAKAHYEYWNGGNRQSSCDFVVDDHSVWQINDYNVFFSWHCGDGNGRYGISNGNSIGIEICINNGANFSKAIENAVELVKHLMRELDITADDVVRHYDASRKICPAQMSQNDWSLWKQFKLDIVKEEKPMPLDYEKIVSESGTSDWAKEAMLKAYKKGVIIGDENGNIKPQESVTKEQLMVMFDRLNLLG